VAGALKVSSKTRVKAWRGTVGKYMPVSDRLR
jgi:hypothetical protein